METKYSNRAVRVARAWDARMPRGTILDQLDEARRARLLALGMVEPYRETLTVRKKRRGRVDSERQ